MENEARISKRVKPQQDKSHERADGEILSAGFLIHLSMLELLIHERFLRISHESAFRTVYQRSSVLTLKQLRLTQRHCMFVTRYKKIVSPLKGLYCSDDFTQKKRRFFIPL